MFFNADYVKTDYFQGDTDKFNLIGRTVFLQGQGRFFSMFKGAGAFKEAGKQLPLESVGGIFVSGKAMATV